MVCFQRGYERAFLSFHILFLPRNNHPPRFSMHIRQKMISFCAMRGRLSSTATMRYPQSGAARQQRPGGRCARAHGCAGQRPCWRSGQASSGQSWGGNAVKGGILRGGEPRRRRRALQGRRSAGGSEGGSIGGYRRQPPCQVLRGKMPPRTGTDLSRAAPTGPSVSAARPALEAS